MPKVLLIGWDGAGWNQIHPVLDSGAMPNLSQVEMDQVKTVYALTRTGNHDALNELASKELQAYETTPAGAM